METVSNTQDTARNTPGPWMNCPVDEHHTNILRFVQTGQPHHEMVATVWGTPCTTIDTATYEANARLIAAAPDLLRQLIRLANRCPGRMPDPRYGAWHDGCCDEARALIRRVQGEAE